MIKTVTAALASLALLAIAGCCHGHGNGDHSYRSTTIEKVAKAPASFSGSRIEVRGTLANAGANYFADLRLVIQDQAGLSIAVANWLPLEVPPPRIKNPGARRPPVLSDFLGKQVMLRGTWQAEGPDHRLRVEEATIIEEGKL